MDVVLPFISLRRVFPCSLAASPSQVVSTGCQKMPMCHLAGRDRSQSVAQLCLGADKAALSLLQGELSLEGRVLLPQQELKDNACLPSLVGVQGRQAMHILSS